MKERPDSKGVAGKIKNINFHNILFDNMLGGTAYHEIVLDDEGRPVDYIFLAINSAFEELTGLRKEDIIGRKVTEVLPGIVGTGYDWIGVYGKVALTGKPVTFEQYSEPLERWYSVSAFCPVPCTFATVFNDITEIKKREEQLTAILSMSSTVLTGNRFEETARAICTKARELTGAKVAYVVLQSAEGSGNDVLYLEDGSESRAVNPGLPLALNDLHTEVYTKGQVQFENDLTGADPLNYVPEGHLRLESILCSPLKIGGRTMGLIGLVNKDGGFDDNNAITAGALGNLAAVALSNSIYIQELKQKQDQFASVVQTANDAIICIDSLGAIMSWNTKAHEIFGYGEQEMLGGSVETIVPKRYLQAHRAGMKRLEETGESHLTGKIMEMWALGRGDVEFPVELSIGKWETDGKTYFTGIVRDISDRKRLDEQIRHTQKLESLGILAGGIAHDFNNLLMGIMGGAGLALIKLSSESPAREYLNQIEATALRASELTNQMLAYSGKSRFVVKPVNLSKLIMEMDHLLGTVISKNAVVRYELADGLPFVNADASQIRQVVMNLISNASDAVGKTNGVVRVTTGSQWCDHSYFQDVFIKNKLDEGYYDFLEVSDTGMGMDRETCNRIFDPFFTTKEHGRGLGLAAVLGILKGHGGTIKVYSEPGKGTTIKILLPVSADSPAGGNPG